MANLVSPGYSRGSLISSLLAPTTSRMIEFKGLNRKESVSEGEMSDMLNMSSDKYPLLAPRKLRGHLNPGGDIYYLVDAATKYNRTVLLALDMSLLADPTHPFERYGRVALYYEDLSTRRMDRKMEIDLGRYWPQEDWGMVSINNKLCFFPSAQYVQIDKGDSTIDEEPTVTGPKSLGYSTLVSDCDVTISNTDARMTSALFAGFKKDDAINISGTATYTSKAGTTATKSITASCIIENTKKNSDGDTILVLPRETFIELTGDGATNIKFEGKLSREVPVLKHVVEWNNRLWGVSDETNTIYCCKLGDPTNWQYFQGTGMDSYYAEQSSEGEWTGAAVYSGHLIFFKENSMTRIYGTSPSTWQVSVTECFGVEKGSSNSVCVVNDRVFYKSPIGFMAYDGGVPYRISENLGVKFKNAVCGSDGMKAYVSYVTTGGERELVVLDIDKGVWHKEDALRFSKAFKAHNYLCLLAVPTTAEDEAYEGLAASIVTVNPDTPSERMQTRQWYAVFGPFDEYSESTKIYSKISLRLIAHSESVVKVYIKTDEEDKWELIQRFDFADTGGDVIQIVPRRCDRFSIKVEGVGDVDLKSLTRRYRAGSEVKEV